MGIEFDGSRHIIPTQQVHALLEWFYDSCTDEDAEDDQQVSAEGLEIANNLMEILFRKYFERAENLNYSRPGVAAATASSDDPAAASTLVKSSTLSMDTIFIQSALEAGIPREKLEAYVSQSSEGVKLRQHHTASVMAKDNYAKNQMRVDGVPFFVMDNQNSGKKPVVVSGGQPIQAMIGYLRNCTKA